MREPIAEIVSLSDGRATVSVEGGVACPRCAAGRGCGAALLEGAPPERRFELEVPHGMALSPGDRVRLHLSPRHLLEASLAVYGWPLAALVAVPGVANVAWGPLSDAALAALAVCGVAATLAVTRRRLARNACLERFVPSIAGRVSRG